VVGGGMRPDGGRGASGSRGVSVGRVGMQAVGGDSGSKAAEDGELLSIGPYPVMAGVRPGEDVVSGDSGAGCVEPEGGVGRWRPLTSDGVREVDPPLVAGPCGSWGLGALRMAFGPAEGPICREGAEGA